VIRQALEPTAWNAAASETLTAQLTSETVVLHSEAARLDFILECPDGKEETHGTNGAQVAKGMKWSLER
jgi:hypothetical protein